MVSVLANQLDARGWDVDICALTDDRTISRELRPGIAVRFEAPIRARFRPLQILWRMLKGARLVASYRRDNPEALVISFIAWVNICATLGSARHRGGLTLSERTDPARDPSNRLAQRLRDICYRKADRMVFQTPDAMHYFDRTIRSHSRVIGNPLTLGLPQWQPDQSTDTVVAVSRLESEKNIALLVRAFHKFVRANPGYHLIVYGEGKQRAALERLTESLSIAELVEFPGHASEVHERLKSGSMFVLSSDFEGMPNALLEAMSMGMPVISSDCPIGGPRMLIDDGSNGLLVPVGDAQTMADAMTRFAKDPGFARSLASRAKQVGVDYDQQRIVSQWEELLLELLSERGTRARA